ncbi:hypothetical protein GCM10025869_26210 [Homoserinibacter gongjuensis]|uniref:GMP reductase n=1 Tax=Homoserinibacter gongjuensis TaxID=1162968 RepID=A0ABQ6JWL2_9MICO|nr:hypothetical protein GCM10025869_26210 [Homoserinibacter gongjuensis]
MRFTGQVPAHDLTYSDVFLVPSRSGVASRLSVDLATTDGTGATIPIVSANMNSVTGPRLSATLARRGGLGVLPQDLPLQELDAAIRWVKEQPVRWDAPIELSADATVADALRVVPAIAADVVVLRDADDGEAGCVPAARLATALPDARLGDLVHGGVTSSTPTTSTVHAPRSTCSWMRMSTSRSCATTAAWSDR